MKLLDKTFFRSIFIIAMLIGTLGLTACEQDGPMENAGEEIDEAVEDVEDSAEDAGDDIDD